MLFPDVADQSQYAKLLGKYKQIIMEFREEGKKKVSSIFAGFSFKFMLENKVQELGEQKASQILPFPTLIQ